jgi:hypothetical protein
MFSTGASKDASVPFLNHRHLKHQSVYQYSHAKLVIDGRVFVIVYEGPRQHVEIGIKNERFNILGYWSDAEADED